jgi:hypothetical protein
MRKIEAAWKYGEVTCFKKYWFSDFCAECVAFERCSARAWLRFTMKAPGLAQRKPDFLRRARANFRKQRPPQPERRYKPRKRYPKRKYPEDNWRKGERRSYSKRR